MIGSAFGQTEVCPGELAVAEWREAMDGVDDALIAGDGTRADRILDALVYELRCARVPATPDDVGRLARQLALVGFFAQDTDEVEVWGLLARQTVGGAPWPADVPMPESFFTMLEQVADPPAVRAEGGLAAPRGGGVLLDGFLIREPVAVATSEHLGQLVDKRGVVVSTWWQQGASFPDELLTPEPTALEVPRWYVAPVPPPPGDRPGSEPPEPVPEPEPVAEPEPPEPEPVAEPPEPELPEPLPEPLVRFDGDGKTAECPWKLEPRQVEASRASVRINKFVYPVRTDEDQVTFRKVLRACGEFRAARRFTKWQVARGKWFSRAGRYRDAMVDALLSEEPVRRESP